MLALANVPQNTDLDCLSKKAEFKEQEVYDVD